MRRITSVFWLGLIWLVLNGCGKSNEAPSQLLTLPDATRLYVTTTDFKQSSALSVIELDSGKVHKAVAPVHSDSLVRAPKGGGSVMVINRKGADNIQMVDRSTLKTTGQFSVGRGANPHDIVVIGEHAYISRFESATLLKVSLPEGKKVGEISFRSFDDGDGFAEMSRMMKIRNRLLVQVKQLDKENFYQDRGYSYIATINLDNDNVENRVLLPISNPYSDFKLGYDGNIYLTCVGSFEPSRKDGGILQLDSESLGTKKLISTQEKLGGDPLDVEVFSKNRGVAIVYNSKMATELIQFNPETGERTKVLLNPKAYTLSSMVWDGKERLYIADRSKTKPGVRVFDVKTLEQVGFYDVGIPPFQMALSF